MYAVWIFGSFLNHRSLRGNESARSFSVVFVFQTMHLNELFNCFVNLSLLQENDENSFCLENYYEEQIPGTLVVYDRSQPEKPSSKQAFVNQTVTSFDSLEVCYCGTVFKFFLPAARFCRSLFRSLFLFAPSNIENNFL